MSVLVVALLLASLMVVCNTHLHNKSQIEDKNHLRQHLNGQVDLDKMSEEELRFNYFKAHDVEGNDMLDGCELIQSILHFHAEEASTFGVKSFSDAELSMMIDPVLQAEDKNFDGFIDYSEFVSAQTNLVF